MADFDYQTDVPDGTLDAHKKYSHPLVDRVSFNVDCVLF